MKILRIILFFVALSIFGEACADFAATEVEFRAWPDYCQAKYSLTNIGTQIGFSGRATPLQIKRAQSLLGKFFVHVHHYCWAIAEERRFIRTKKNHWLEMATGDAIYSLQRIDSRNVLYPMVLAVNARLEFYAGNIVKAMSILDLGIDKRPDSQILYYFKAFILRKQGKIGSAQKILSDGLRVIHEPGSEYHYLYGLVCLEAKDLECAKDQAQLAYAKGYPLQGLKNMLKRKGVEIN